MAGHAEKSDISFCCELQVRRFPPMPICRHPGILDYADLASQTHDRMSTVFKAKVAGAWNLHEATKDMPIESFVMFSSVAELPRNMQRRPVCRRFSDNWQKQQVLASRLPILTMLANWMAGRLRRVLPGWVLPG